MSQHDLVIDNGSGAVVRADINNALQALGTLQSGPSAPTTTYAYMLWADTTNGLLKIRNQGNTGWITLGQIATYFGFQFFPSGTKMLFYQDTAPTGWTIQNTLDDKLVYITKGSAAGGQTGGGVHSSGSWTISGFGNVGDTTLSTTQIPAHSHTIGSEASHNHSVGWVAGEMGSYVGFQRSIEGSSFGSYNTSVGSSHTHSCANTGGGGSHTHSGPSHNGTWRPAAYCCIIAQKD